MKKLVQYIPLEKKLKKVLYQYFVIILLLILINYYSSKYKIETIHYEI